MAFSNESESRIKCIKTQLQTPHNNKPLKKRANYFSIVVKKNEKINSELRPIYMKENRISI